MARRTDDEIKNMAGHEDAIPAIYREWFLKGFRESQSVPLIGDWGGDRFIVAEITKNWGTGEATDNLLCQ